MSPRTVLLLRTVSADGTSYGGFRWPLEVGAEVAAPDWSPEPQCGNGLHGLLWGQGDATLMDLDRDARGLVVEADADQVVELGDKVKVPRVVIRFVGTLPEAAEWLQNHQPEKTRAGYRGTATAGDFGTATAGDRGTATAGYHGTATAGDFGTATAGDFGTATAGKGGVIAIRYWNGKRYKVRVATVKDEDGDGEVLPSTRYRLNERHEFEVVPADGAA